MDLLPIEKIRDLLREDPKFSVLENEEILKYDAESYNLPIFIRAHNNDPTNNQLGHYYNQIENPKLREMLNINLPQFLVHDNLGYKDHIISLHIAKIRSDEVFINDIVTKRNNVKLLKNGIAAEIIERLTQLSRSHNIKYISGHACSSGAYQTFINKGFQADTRSTYGNDILYQDSLETEGQIPFYKKIQ